MYRLRRCHGPLITADLPSDPEALRAFAAAYQAELAATSAELTVAKLAVQLRTLEFEKLLLDPLSS